MFVLMLQGKCFVGLPSSVGRSESWRLLDMTRVLLNAVVFVNGGAAGLLLTSR